MSKLKLGAHFHVPQEWIDATLMNPQSFTNLLDIAEDELDWPFMSASTGIATVILF